MFDHTKAKSLVNDDTNSLVSVIAVLIGESTQDHIITCILLCTCNCIFVLLLSIIFVTTSLNFALLSGLHFVLRPIILVTSINSPLSHIRCQQWPRTQC
jgi:hypothetical protein